MAYGNRADDPLILSTSGYNSEGLREIPYWWEIELELADNFGQTCMQNETDSKLSLKFPHQPDCLYDLIPSTTPSPICDQEKTRNEVEEGIINIHESPNSNANNTIYPSCSEQEGNAHAVETLAVEPFEDVHFDNIGQHAEDSALSLCFPTLHYSNNPEPNPDNFIFTKYRRDTDDANRPQEKPISIPITTPNSNSDNFIQPLCMEEEKNPEAISQDVKEQFLALLELTEGKDFWPALGAFNKKYPLPVPENAWLAIEEERKNGRRINTYTQKTPMEVHLEYLDVLSLINSGKDFGPGVSNFLQNFRTPNPKPARPVAEKLQADVEKDDIIIGQEGIGVDKSLLDSLYNTTVSENTSLDSEKEVSLNIGAKTQLELHFEFLSLMDIIDSSKDCWPALASFIKQFPISDLQQATTVPEESQSLPQNTTSENICTLECRCPIPEEHNFIVKFQLMETPDIDLSEYTIERVVRILERVLKWF